MIYLDNAATTQPKFFAKDYAHMAWGNANSDHQTGLASYHELEKARDRVKKALGLKSGEVLFCSSASQAIQALAHRFAGQIKVGRKEHDSVWEVMSIPRVITSLDTTKLYCCQYANPITGDIFSDKIERLIDNNTDDFIGSDLTAAVGHCYLSPDILNDCDALWFSGHKFHVEKGIGCLWVSNRMKEYLNLSRDYKNEHGMFPGTVNVPGVLALVAGLEEAQANLYEHTAFFHNLNVEFLDACDSQGFKSIALKTAATRTEAINLFYVPNVFDVEPLIQFLSEEKEICISGAHSACSSSKSRRVTEALGIDAYMADSSIRVSYGVFNKYDDVRLLALGIREYINKYC